MKKGKDCCYICGKEFKKHDRLYWMHPGGYEEKCCSQNCLWGLNSKVLDDLTKRIEQLEDKIGWGGQE